MTTLRVPARCYNGHHLEPRTTYVRHTGATSSRSGLTPVGWECVVCVRVACWTAQFPGRAVPAELLEPENYKRQIEATNRARLPKFALAVHFQSGWQFADPARHRSRERNANTQPTRPSAASSLDRSASNRTPRTVELDRSGASRPTNRYGRSAL